MSEFNFNIGIFRGILGMLQFEKLFWVITVGVQKWLNL